VVILGTSRTASELDENTLGSHWKQQNKNKKSLSPSPLALPNSKEKN